jgi:hypothetical protein
MVKKSKVTILMLLSSMLVSAQCINDTINPWFVDFEHEITIECGDFVNTAMPVTDDDCDGNVEIQMIEEVVPGNCEGQQTIYRLYRAFDDAGNQVVETQTVHVVDETPPTFTKLSDRDIACGESVVFDQPMAVDNCSFASLSSFDTLEVIDDCTTSYIRIWSAQDACGNASTAQQTVTIADLESPTIVGTPYIELQEGMSVTDNYIVALDNCSEAEVTYTDVEVSGNSVIRTYTATDACGNQSTFEQILHTNNNLVAICHELGNGNWITIHVAPQAVPAHLAHGDYLGPCRTDSNQLLPYLNLERLPDGSVRKIVRVSR